MVPVRRLVRRTAPALLSIVTLTLTHAQKQSTQPLSRAALEVDGTMLHLGMTKAQVAEKLARARKITKLDEDDWFLGSIDEGQSPGPTLQFTRGLLSYVDREWPTHNNDIAESLFGVVTSLNDEGFSRCVVTTDTQALPLVTKQQVWINCGEKGVVILRSHMGEKFYNSVYEMLGRKRSAK